MRVAVIYWSGTGNTKLMAEGVALGLKEKNIEVDMVNVEEVGGDIIGNVDGLALGCPSMGDEVLEEYTMAPFVEGLSDRVKNLPIILFGSYGWGNGEWMLDWENQMIGYGAKLLKEGLIINDTPDDEGIGACVSLGRYLADSI